MTENTMKTDLNKSGLTVLDGKKMQTKYINEAAIAELTGFKQTTGYKIPYFDINQKKTKFFRIRLFTKGPKRLNFKKNDIPKYWQPIGTDSHIYFPPFKNWDKIASDPSINLYITEGEKKASKACKVGLETIGLGGVWSFKSNKAGLPLIKDFEKFNLAKRKILIVFDSDSYLKKEVRQAQIELAKALTAKGAVVLVKNLPFDRSKKIGLDDYFLDHSLTDFNNLPEEPFNYGEEVHHLNERFCIIKNIQRVYEFETAVTYTFKNFVDVFANEFFNDVVDGKVKKKPLAKAWLDWEYRNTANTLVYEPGQPLFTESNDVNVWKPSKCLPVKGSIAPFKKLIDHLFQNDIEFKNWFWQWLAYPIQNPGVKMTTAIVLWSLLHGNGKSFLGYIVQDMYGENGMTIGQDDLHSNWNDWLMRKQFILGEEITGLSKRRDADRIKGLISQESITVRARFTNTFMMRDCANYLFTSNHPDAFMIEDHDRRFAVHEITADPLPNAYYQELEKWRGNGGASHLAWYLLNKVNVKKFLPKAPALLTEAKREMIAISRTEEEIFAHELREAPESILRLDHAIATRDVYTSTELIAFFDPTGRKNVSPRFFAAALKKVGFRKLPPLHTSSGTKRLWIVRNLDKWAKATPKAIAEHYDAGAMTTVKTYKKSNVIKLRKK